MSAQGVAISLIVVAFQVNSMVVSEQTFRAQMTRPACSLSIALQKTQVALFAHRRTKLSCPGTLTM